MRTMDMQRMSSARIATWLVVPLCVASLLAATSVVPASDPVAAAAAPAVAVPAAAPAAVPAVEPAPAPSAEPVVAGKYIGAAKCKNCHSAEKTGDQYGHWEKMLHAKAFETLAGDKAKELAKAKGIDDPQKADACLKCHVTAFGEPADNLAKGFKPEMGVQCESCHGPAETHMKARMAAAARRTRRRRARSPRAKSSPSRTSTPCVKCHNPESPSYKPVLLQGGLREDLAPEPREEAHARGAEEAGRSLWLRSGRVVPVPEAGGGGDEVATAR
jgi:mono/diheme cytochrome c family protein